MKAALAAALVLASVSAATASPARDDRYFVAWGATSLDVTRAMRCAPPIGCHRAVQPRHKRYRKAYAQRRPLVRYSAPAAAPVPPKGKGLAGVVPALAAKALEIVGACGSRVISAVRHTYVAGTRKLSLHASGKAVDLAGNPGCIYSMLRGWPGGVSTDYARVRHVHISHDQQGRREWGLRFAHGGHRHRLSLYARRHLHRHRHRRRA